MARPRKDSFIDLTIRHDLSAGLVERLTCPPDKAQAFLRDTAVPGLAVRITAAGAKSYIYETKLNRRNIRRTIGDVKVWTMDSARAEARKLAVTIDQGQDPRELDRQAEADRQARQAELIEAAKAEERAGITVGEVWTEYLAERRTVWGDRHYADHVTMSKPGGEVAQRGVKRNPDGSKPLTVPGPVFELLPLPLRELTPNRIEYWAAEHAKVRPTYARLCWRCLKVFLNWCGEHPEYSALLTTSNPAKTKRAREALGKPTAKDDALQREQLPLWFAAVRNIGNPVISAYLQVLLLTGARPGEVITLQWEDINTQWKGITIRDKVDGERVIPLTPYVASLLANLPKRNEWVFSSTKVLSMDPVNVERRAERRKAQGKDSQEAQVGDVVNASASGRLMDPSHAHRCACATCGLDGLSLHGLRRSFASLTEWLEISAGVVAQIQGHKPSATAEKHYKRRPLDLLRVHHERIEAWVLEQAGLARSGKVSEATLIVVQ